MADGLNVTDHQESERIDVVIPTMGEPSLYYCLKSVRRSMQVNKIILVCPGSAERSLGEVGDARVVLCDESNVGRARAQGLEYVSTPYYASVDSDVIVNRKWFEWCMKAIKENDVAACQGFLSSVGRHTDRMLRHTLKHGYYADLGNTILKTNIVRAVGMPEKAYQEDRELKLRIENRGCKWVINASILCEHLRSDLDTWRHAARWAALTGVDPYSFLNRVQWAFTEVLLKYGATDCLFVICSELFRLCGYWGGFLRHDIHLAGTS